MDLGHGEKSQHRALGFDQRIQFRYILGGSPVVKTHASPAGARVQFLVGELRSHRLPSMARRKDPVQIPALELSLWTTHFFELLFIASRMQGGLSRPQRVMRVHSELGLRGYPWHTTHVGSDGLD